MDINIIGMGHGKELAIGMKGHMWGLTRVIFEMPVEILFDIHKPEENRICGGIDKKCKEHGAFHYTCDNFPLYEMVKEFRTAYFTSSVAYALAFAITKHPENINLFGVNCSYKNREEYYKQKACVDFWVGLAMGRGISVNVDNKQSEVRRGYKGLLYGYGLKQSEVEKCI